MALERLVVNRRPCVIGRRQAYCPGIYADSKDYIRLQPHHFHHWRVYTVLSGHCEYLQDSAANPPAPETETPSESLAQLLILLRSKPFLLSDCLHVMWTQEDAKFIVPNCGADQLELSRSVQVIINPLLTHYINPLLTHY